MSKPKSLELRGVTLHDLRSARCHMARIQDKRDGHRWVLIVESEEPIAALDGGGEPIRLHLFTAADKEGEPLKLLPQKSSALGDLIEQWRKAEGVEEDFTWDEPPVAPKATAPKATVSVQTRGGVKQVAVGDVLDTYLDGRLAEPATEDDLSDTGVEAEEA